MTAQPDAKPLVWALDIATVTGFAVGRTDAVPQAQAVRFAPSHASTIDVLCGGCLEWFSEIIERGPLPDILALEELLPPTARRGTTNTGAQHRLAGLHGVIRALARRAKIPEVVSANVQDVRQHFIHQRGLPREKAKQAVMHTCKLLGWQADDADCADALALWSHTVALIDPHSALRLTPLFGHRTWADVARDRLSKRG
jgi:hypothetical protein